MKKTEKRFDCVEMMHNGQAEVLNPRKNEPDESAGNSLSFSDLMSAAASVLASSRRLVSRRTLS